MNKISTVFLVDLLQYMSTFLQSSDFTFSKTQIGTGIVLLVLAKITYVNTVPCFLVS